MNVNWLEQRQASSVEEGEVSTAWKPSGGFRAWEWWLTLGCGLVVLATARQFGVTTDEGVQAEYGELVWRYFISGGVDRRCNELYDLKVYGPLYELISFWAYAWKPEWKFEIRHVVCGLTATLMVPPSVALGRRIGGEVGAVFTALGLLTLPQLIGHSCNNSKDIPTACGFIWSVWALVEVASGPARSFATRDRIITALGPGIALGLTMAVRPAAMLMLNGLLALAWLSHELRERMTQPPWLRSRWGVWSLLATLTIAWSLMVLAWPWARQAPWLHPLKAIATATAFHTVYPVTFEGRLLWSDQLPARYLIQTLAITTPLGTLGIAALGLGIAIVHLIRRPWDDPSQALLLVVAAFVGPILGWTLTRTNIYDGMRQFLFVLPPMAILFGVGCARLVQQGQSPQTRVGAAVFLASLTLWNLGDLVRLHPYQHTFHNAFVGGVAGADDRYDLDYWRASYKEAIEWVNRQPRSDPRQPLRVLVAGHPASRWCADWYKADHVETILMMGPASGPLPPGIDYVVATKRPLLRAVTSIEEARRAGRNAAFRPDQNYADAPVVHRVGRGGATFTVIRGRAATADRSR